MSNLIAVKNSSNEVGLGTSYIGLGSTGTSVLPFKVDETNAILMNFNTSNNSINLGTINSGVWQGSPIEIEYGGLGNIASGSANQILAVNSQGTGYNWINNQLDISTNTEIATNVTSAVGIGSTTHDLTINTSKLNINIGNTTPQEGQVLKYTNDSLTWSDANLVSIDKLWTLMKTLHPGYVMFLKSIQVLNNGASAGTLVPIFNPTITNYDVNVGSNISVAIVPTTFSFPSGTTITTTQIDDNVINNPNEYVLVDLNNTYNIKNSYTENSETHTKTYTLNITRNTLLDNNINSLVLKESVSQNTETLNELANNIYKADVDTIQDIEILLEVNRTVKAINVISNSPFSQLNITKNNNSIIGTSSALIGIDSTSNSNDINISSGRITDVIFQITAENDSNKTYTLKISNPPRNNAEVDKITITKIDSLNSPAPDLNIPNPSPGNISNLSISEQYDKIRFSIDRKNSSQTNQIFKNDLIQQTIGASAINLINTNSINFSSYNNTIPSTSNSITDTFKIVNISPDGNTTNNYEVSCPIEKSSNIIPESIIIYTGSNPSNINNQLFKIDTNTELSNTNHNAVNSAILSFNSVNIQVIRNGGQQITLSPNTSGINHTADIPFYVNGDNNTSFKTISLSNSNVYNFVLEVTAENNSDTQTYNISINTDNVSPQVQSFTLSDTSLKIGDTSNVTIVFTEEIQDLINISITVNGGTLDNRSANQANTILTGTFNPLSNSTISGRITVESGYKDSANNEGQAQASALITIDTTSLILQEYTDSSTTLSSTNYINNPVYKFTSNKNLNISDISIGPGSGFNSYYSITSSGTTIISGNTSYIYKIAFINLSYGSTYNKSIIASDHVDNITILGIPSFTIQTPQYKTIGFSISSSIAEYDTYDIHLYLNNVNGTLKWGWVYTGVIDDYKFVLQNISGDDYKILIGSTMVDTGYIAQQISGDNYIIKNGNQYLQNLYLSQTSLESYTNTMIQNDNKNYFVSTTWSGTQVYFKVELYSNIKIPGAFRINRHQLTNNVNGQATNTFLLYPDYLRSPDGENILIMQRDGNLAFYYKYNNSWNITWQTYTNYPGRHGNGLVIQSDGNVAVYVGNRSNSTNNRTDIGTPAARTYLLTNDIPHQYGWQSATYNSSYHVQIGGAYGTSTRTENVLWTPSSVLIYVQTNSTYYDWFDASVSGNTITVTRDYVSSTHGWGQNLYVNAPVGNTGIRTIQITNNRKFEILYSNNQLQKSVN